jgi:hypothetical protein
MLNLAEDWRDHGMNEAQAVGHGRLQRTKV